MTRMELCQIVGIKRFSSRPVSNKSNRKIHI